MTSKKRVSVAPARLKLLDDAGERGVLLGTACSRCGAHFFGSVVFCQDCTSADLKPVELNPRGSLYSYTVVRVPPAGWQGDVPYALGQVQTQEGPHVVSEVVGCPFEELKVGMEMEMALVVGGEDLEGNELVVYKWRPRQFEEG